MANKFGTDILIQAADPMEAADFYIGELGFEVTDKRSNMVSLHGQNINFFIERGPALGPVLEVNVKSGLRKRKRASHKRAARYIKDEPEISRCYIQESLWSDL